MSIKSTGCDKRDQHFCYPGDEGDFCMWGPEVGIKCEPFKEGPITPFN